MSTETIAQAAVAIIALTVAAGLVLAGRSPRLGSRYRGLDIRPLGPAATERYRREWAGVQDQLGDEPDHAIAEADQLVAAVMVERGYPTEPTDGGRHLAELPPGHARTLDHYRQAHEISSRAARHGASTEDLRQAVSHYRILFEELLDEDATAARQ